MRTPSLRNGNCPKWNHSYPAQRDIMTHTSMLRTDPKPPYKSAGCRYAWSDFFTFTNYALPGIVYAFSPL